MLHCTEWIYPNIIRIWIRVLTVKESGRCGLYSSIWRTAWTGPALSTVVTPQLVRRFSVAPVPAPRAGGHQESWHPYASRLGWSVHYSNGIHRNGSDRLRSHSLHPCPPLQNERTSARAVGGSQKENSFDLFVRRPDSSSFVRLFDHSFVCLIIRSLVRSFICLFVRPRYPWTSTPCGSQPCQIGCQFESLLWIFLVVSGGKRTVGCIAPAF